MLWKWFAAGMALATIVSAHAQAGRRHPPPRQEGEMRLMPQPQAEPTQRDLPRFEHYQQAVRMTPEERRQLRRDIHDAGRELYQREPPPRPQP